MGRDFSSLRRSGHLATRALSSAPEIEPRLSQSTVVQKSLVPVTLEPVVDVPAPLQNALSALQKEKTSHPKRLRQLGKKIVESIKMRSLSKHRGGIQPNLYDQRVSPTVLRGARRQQEKQALKALTQHVFRAEEWNEDVLKSYPEYQVLKASAEKSMYQRELQQLGGAKLYNGLGALAYASARLPSTYAAIKHVLQRLKMSRMDDWVPQSMLDFGAGPGTAAWAAQHVWPSSPIRVTAVENSQSMANIGYEIMDMCSSTAPMDIRWRPYFPRHRGALSKHDICIAAYSLNELYDSVERHQVLNKLIHSSQQYIVLIEPGTPHGFSMIEDARSYILKVSRKLGVPFHVVAPCPHDGACPLRGTKSWCHFSQRHKRTEEQRVAVKSLTGKAPRDTFMERFSYVVLKRGLREALLPAGSFDEKDDDEVCSTAAAALMEHASTTSLKSLHLSARLGIPNSRILRARKRKGHVILDLCTVLDETGAHLGGDAGTVLRQTVSRAKSNSSWDKGGAYRASRALKPGDEWPLLYQAGSAVIEAPVLHKEYLFPDDNEDDNEEMDSWFGDDNDDIDN